MGNFGFLALVAVVACAPSRYEQAAGDVERTDHMADAVMRAADGSLLGTLHLTQRSDSGVRLIGELRGVPAGMHGIHIHEVGSCIAPSFVSAGGHFNPYGREHGLQNPAGPHAGDAPNVLADSATRVSVYLRLPALALSGGPGNVLDADGSAIVIHAQADDQRQDPSGNSGARIACGVIVGVGR